MTIVFDGTNGITFPAGGLANPSGNLVSTGGNLVLQTADTMVMQTAGTTAVTIGSDQSVTMTGNLTVSGNIAGDYILGNGSQLTGLPEGYGNANVAAYLPTYTGNLGGNLISTNAVGTNQIANSAVTAAKLSSTAVTDSLGYTPVNRAGDTMTGGLTVNASGMVFESRNADTYSRFTASNGSAQVGLFRSGDSAGGFYIGGDATSFKVYNSSFTPVLLADSSGRVTMPYQPLFSASDTRALNITDAVLTSSNCFDSIDYNVGSHFNAATGRFTVPIAGFYDCSFYCADVSASGKDTNMRIRKNGVANTGPLAEAYNQAGLGATNVSVRCVIQCAVGDYIDFQAARLNTVGSIQHKRFIIHLLG